LRILHINYTDTVGQRFNGFRLSQKLKGSAVSEMAVWKKQSEETFVKQIPPNNRLAWLLWSRTMMLFSRFGLDRLVGFGGWILRKNSYFKSADIIHLHLIHNFSNFSIFSLPFISKLKPVVWTLHDPWAYTGGCEHSFDCNKWQNGCSVPCPHPRATSLFQKSAPNLHWKIKKYLYSKSTITLVVSSDWMLERVKKSPLMKDFDCIKIPFGIDLKQFKLLEKFKAKSKLGIPTNHKVIAFRDSGLKKDKFKGLRWLKDALEVYEVNEPTTLLIFEKGDDFKFLENKFNVICLGWIDGDELVTALSAADIFIMPSIQESFGLMAVESMACGTPVIVFEGTALPSIVKHGIGGIVIPLKDTKALAEGILNILNDNDLRLKMSAQARKIVEDNYNEDQYVESHIELYKKVISEFKND
jgi:glycosyltransferase involved in cell wall biosynthesis